MTCEPHRSNQAVKQVMALCEDLAGPLEDIEAAQEPVKELSLDEELQEMKASKKKSRFVSYISDVAGNVFIRFVDERDDPFAVMEKMFNGIREVKKSTIPHVVRLFPILASGFPNTEESVPMLAELLPKMFTPEKQLAYEVVITRKHKGDGQKESHDELNAKIVALVGPPHTPTYRGSEAAVLWISLGRNLYMSVVPKWREWCGCNVPKFCAALELAE